MWFNLICYQLKINLFTYITDISEPHGDHKVKIYSKYTEIMRTGSKCNTKERHQTTRKESNRKKNRG